LKMDGETRKPKFPSHCRLVRDPRERDSGGWREALVSGGKHLKRVLDEYGELGFECLLEELGEEELPGCTHCYKCGGEPVYRVFIRGAR